MSLYLIEDTRHHFYGKLGRKLAQKNVQALKTKDLKFQSPSVHKIIVVFRFVHHMQIESLVQSLM